MKKLMLTLCATFVFTTAYLQHSIPMAQTLFIQDFLRLVTWPETCMQESFVIGVLGNSDVFDELVSQLDGKTLGNQRVHIRRFNTPDDISGCHILFIPFSETRYLGTVSQRLSENNTLIITEKNGALKEGSAINFVIYQQRMRFEISTANAGKHGLDLSPQLREMAMHSM